ncbi:hypothetical protein ANTPLA_LOCUS4869 [Anthophora plagiata]
MRSRLRNIKKTKKLGGKNKLTDRLIKQLTLYYGLAIRRHSNFIDDMGLIVSVSGVKLKLRVLLKNLTTSHHFVKTLQKK